jgi:hypothetical protein
MAPSDSLSPVDCYRKLLRQIVTAHSNFASIVSIKTEDGENSSMLVEYGALDSQITYRDSIRAECRAKYQQEMTKLIKHILPSSASTDGSGSTKLSLLLRMLGEHKSNDEFHLVPTELWENGKINAVMIVLERLWSNNNVEKDFSFERMDYSFHSFRSPNALGATTSVSMTLEAIKLVISNGSPAFITSIVEKVLIPLIDTLRSDICRVALDDPVVRSSRTPGTGDPIDLVSSDSSRSSSPTHESNEETSLWGNVLRFAIMKLESCALQLLPSVSDLGTQIKLLESVIKKKISIRENLPGYTICVHELLKKYADYKEQKFVLFCVLLHSPVPLTDLTWAAIKLDQHPYFDFTRDILGSRLLASEVHLRELLLDSALKPTPASLNQRDLSSLSTTPLKLSMSLPLIKQEGGGGRGTGVTTSTPHPSVKYERLDSSVKRKRRSDSQSSHSSDSSHVHIPSLPFSHILQVEEVLRESEPPVVLTMSPPPSPPRVTPAKITPSRRRLVTSRGEC